MSENAFSMASESLVGKIDAIKTTSEVIALSLKEMIYQAELKPGQPLIQENIAKMFGVSRVPVRDALQLLIQMGIAVNIPRRGVIVRPLSSKLLNELFDVRKILEGAAIRLAAEKIGLSQLKALTELIRQQREALEKGDVKGNAKLDDEFHRTLYRTIGNETLVELIFSNWERIKQARCASTVLPEHGKAWIVESAERHTKLLEALQKNDPALAQQVIVENIEASKREIGSCLEKMGWIEAGA